MAKLPYTPLPGLIGAIVLGLGGAFGLTGAASADIGLDVGGMVSIRIENDDKDEGSSNAAGSTNDSPYNIATGSPVNFNQEPPPPAAPIEAPWRQADPVNPGQHFTPPTSGDGGLLGAPALQERESGALEGYLALIASLLTLLVFMGMARAQSTKSFRRSRPRARACSALRRLVMQLPTINPRKRRSLGLLKRHVRDSLPKLLRREIVQPLRVDS